MKKVVITGGPCGGKTTVMGFIQENWEREVLLVPEIATQLLNFFPIPNRHLPLTVEWLAPFQVAVFWSQVKAEETWALTRGEKKVMVCDRGVLDGGAYLGDEPAFYRLINHEVEALISRYEVVIHLESLAVTNSDLYLELKEGNPNRYENLEQAVELDTRIKKAWSKHSRQIILKSSDSLDDKKAKVKEIITELLTERGN